MWIAVTRPVSPTLAHCELTHLAREPLDVTLASSQHAAYEDRLRSLGASVVQAPPAPDLPDAVFVEDTAVVLDEVAVIARPGAPSRRAETAAVGALLSAYRPLKWIEAPATLDGGDVLRVGRTLYVGRSGRTNSDGVEQLSSIASALQYAVVPVAISGCLHLKSAATAVDDACLLVNPAWVPPAAFRGVEVVSVDEREPRAANALRIAGSVVVPAQFPRTAETLIARGLHVAPVDCSELAKAEGAVTCCSIVFETR